MFTLHINIFQVVGSFDEGFAESLSKGMNRHDSKRWQVELVSFF